LRSKTKKTSLNSECSDGREKAGPKTIETPELSDDLENLEITFNHRGHKEHRDGKAKK